MNIRLLTVGKIKEKYLVDGINEYKKRLEKYCHLEIIEVQDEKTEGVDSKIVKEKEGERLEKYLKDDYIITLEIKGEKLDSVKFSELIDKVKTYNSSSITFIVGGSLGLSDSIIKKANFHLSFSDLTFPHMLMRLMLLEQIYRSFRILNNEPYHK